MNDSPPPGPGGTYVPTVPRAVEGWPCPHNAWDNLRMRKGIMMLRCRTCGESWKRCDVGEPCPHPHIFKTRHSEVRKDSTEQIPQPRVPATVVLAVLVPMMDAMVPMAIAPMGVSQSRPPLNPRPEIMHILPPSALTTDMHPDRQSGGGSLSWSPQSVTQRLRDREAQGIGTPTHSGSYSPKYTHNPYTAEVLSPTSLVMKGSQNNDFFATPTTRICEKCHILLGAQTAQCNNCGFVRSGSQIMPGGSPALPGSPNQMPTSALMASVFAYAMPPPSPPIHGLNQMLGYQPQGMQGTPGPQPLYLPTGLTNSSLTSPLNGPLHGPLHGPTALHLAPMTGSGAGWGLPPSNGSMGSNPNSGGATPARVPTTPKNPFQT